MTPAIAHSPELVSPVQQKSQKTELFYASEDGEPLAETSIHADAIISAVAILRNYLGSEFVDRSPVVLADQFLYFVEGLTKFRVAPDVMVIFDIPQVPYDNYKIWETGKVPSVIFEFTSQSTQNRDQEYKKYLYQDTGVKEYWLFDPKGEWIPKKLQGYCLKESDRGDREFFYQAIPDGCSQVLGLRLEVETYAIGFYRLDTGEKLLAPKELHDALHTQVQSTEQERQRAETAEQRAETAEQRAVIAEQQAQHLRDRLIAAGIDPDAPD
jgi:Uma2 family endonuclease